MNPAQSIQEQPSRVITSRPPELLAPAGDWECAKAAVENGADAIYFGLERFNARMRAHNFTVADLPRLMEFLHLRGVRGYVTFNTLVFPDEVEQARQYLRSIIAAGVDAAIVQDVGICRMIRQLSPDFPIHASTQMTVTSPAGVEFARELGCNLVVLARECSIREIEAIQQSARSPDLALENGHSMPLEVFVHGALCVAYSGQCLTSESLGGRSANRGECAQACRMPYELISDGKVIPLGDRKYLLSPQDLAGIEVLPDLIHSGVASLKIEGRLKTPEYVANITRVYRQAIDKLARGGVDPGKHFSAVDQYDLEMGFSRGLYSGWFRGINNQELVHARFGKKRGVFLGRVLRVKDGQVTISREGTVKPGDGVVFDSGHPEQPEEGGRVYQHIERGPEMHLRFGRDSIDFRKVHPGDRVWKTSDPELDRRLRQTFASDQPRFQRPLHFEVHGLAGHPLTLIARDDEGHVARSESVMPLEVAEKRPLTTALLREQLGRLGGSPFRLGEIENRLEGDVLLPLSELNRLRRAVVEEIEAQRKTPKRWTLRENSPIVNITRKEGPAEVELTVLIRNMAQLETVLRVQSGRIYCEFEDPKKYRDAVSLFRGQNRDANRTLWVAPPRIFKTGEDWVLRQVLSSGADGYLIRNYDHLNFFRDQRRVGDFSLNVANALSARWFIDRYGLEHLTASYDLNAEQLVALLRSAPPEWFEITLHQHMPMFHMEHCVFCAFLSTGTDYRNCGRPCDKHAVEIRDRVGARHPLKADAGCRNTVFNSQAQTGAEFYEQFVAAGARRFRIEFLNESAEEIEQTLAQYQKLIRGEISGSQLWRDLKLVNQLGVTRGQLLQRKSHS